MSKDMPMCRNHLTDINSRGSMGGKFVKRFTNAVSFKQSDQGNIQESDMIASNKITIFGFVYSISNGFAHIQRIFRSVVYIPSNFAPDNYELFKLVNIHKSVSLFNISASESYYCHCILNTLHISIGCNS